MEKVNSILIIVCLVALSITFLFFQFIENKVDDLEKQIVYLKEDLQTHKDIFNSYLKGELSQDLGGE